MLTTQDDPPPPEDTPPSPSSRTPPILPPLLPTTRSAWPEKGGRLGLDLNLPMSTAAGVTSTPAALSGSNTALNSGITHMTIQCTYVNEV